MLFQKHEWMKSKWMNKCMYECLAHMNALSMYFKNEIKIWREKTFTYLLPTHTPTHPFLTYLQPPNICLYLYITYLRLSAYIKISPMSSYLYIIYLPISYLLINFYIQYISFPPPHLLLHISMNSISCLIIHLSMYSISCLIIYVLLYLSLYSISCLFIFSYTCPCKVPPASPSTSTSIHVQ